MALNDKTELESVRDNAGKQRIFQTDIQITTELRAGILPPPEDLAAYEQIMPGAFDRLLTMAEKDHQAKIDFNLDIVKYKHRVLTIRERNELSDNIFSHCGQVFGFLTVVIYFSILALTAWQGNTALFGLLFCAGAFAGLARLVRSFQEKRKTEGSQSVSNTNQQKIQPSDCV